MEKSEYKFRKLLSNPNYRGIRKTPASKVMKKHKRCCYCGKKGRMVIEHMHQHSKRTQGSQKIPPKHQGCFRGPACYKCNARERETLKSNLKKRNLSPSSFRTRFFSPRFFKEQALKMKMGYPTAYKTKTLTHLERVLDGRYAEDLVRKLDF